jgi:hypothetical protein
MKIKEAINRLGYTISKQNKPNTNDADALNSIIEFVNLSNKQVIKDNELLAKMYCFVLKDFLFYYKNVNFASKQINKDILSKSLEYHLECLKINLETNERTNFFEQNTNLKEINIDAFNESFETWEMDNVIANFEFNFNLALNTYKNGK